ncbi:putative movement protein [Yunnan Paris negative-stranded virus]|uniref:Putative movement protein n=1 Tax=Yunnan Paris negative-stranded virus TaxID=2836142 RepID=A0A8E7DAB7_9VIRU|nr:putative movement protein [Yunnan Paris negative-stranded virus]QVU28733.1 putative movement protein [Yunnan Paris negative-stranded virus]
MFRKVFSRSSSSKNKVWEDKKQPRNSRTDLLESGEDRNETVAQDSMNRAKRQLYQFDLPTTDMGFQDLLKSYEEGNRFQYVALSGSTNETYEARVRRILTLNMATKKTSKPLIKIPLIKLVDSNLQFKLSQAMQKSKNTFNYARLSAVVGVYTPLIGSFYEFSTVSVTLHDTRKVTKTSIQTVKFNSNLQNKFELSMECCFPKSSADRIILDIGLEQSTLIAGEEWGTINMMLQIETSEVPYISNSKDVISVVSMPPSLLENYKNNPNYIDTTITEGQKKTVRDMFESGDIADETEPLREDLKPVTYAKSSSGLKKKGPKLGRNFGDGWEHMREARKPMAREDELSVEPDGSVDLSVNTSERMKAMKGKMRFQDEDPDDILSDVESLRPPPEPKSFKGVSFNEHQV